MTSHSLKTAVEEAQRFIERALTLENITSNIRGSTVLPRDYTDCPKEQGAVKRASMDLTRALSQLRQQR